MKRHYVSIRDDVYDRLAAEAKRRGTTISKLVAMSVVDIAGQDQVDAARRRYRHRSRK